jgi:hypothetical protein
MSTSSEQVSARKLPPQLLNTCPAHSKCICKPAVKIFAGMGVKMFEGQLLEICAGYPLEIFASQRENNFCKPVLL